MADETLADKAATAEEIASTLTISASTFSRVLATGMKNAVAEGYSLDRVMRQAALSISSAGLARGLKPLGDLIGGGLNAALGGIGNALGGTFAGMAGGAAKAMPFAHGGVIGAPTNFAMGGGRVGLMGEAGREAILPLARGPDGRLGVALEGAHKSAGGGTTINVSIATSDADSFQRSEAQVTAMLARAVARGRRGL